MRALAEDIGVGMKAGSRAAPVLDVAEEFQSACGMPREKRWR